MLASAIASMSGIFPTALHGLYCLSGRYSFCTSGRSRALISILKKIGAIQAVCAGPIFRVRKNFPMQIEFQNFLRRCVCEIKVFYSPKTQKTKRLQLFSLQCVKAFLGVLMGDLRFFHPEIFVVQHSVLSSYFI
jgi:hypothetical protein